MVKYQIFVSSTFEDLKEERDQVVKAILEMGHIPVGMEMFSAADEEQWSIIKRNIESSDYYVVIVAHRYGSMVDGIGYTEKEYDFALECKVPVLGFILHESAPWAETKRDVGRDAKKKRDKLSAFKEKVRRKPVDYWKDAHDLHGKVAIALTKTITAQPRTGWIPASHAASAETATELARLSKENAELREVRELAVSLQSDLELLRRGQQETSPVTSRKTALRIEFEERVGRLLVNWNLEVEDSEPDYSECRSILSNISTHARELFSKLDAEKDFPLYTSLRELVRQLRSLNRKYADEQFGDDAFFVDGTNVIFQLSNLRSYFDLLKE